MSWQGSAAATLHHRRSACCYREKSRRIFFSYFVAYFLFIKNTRRRDTFLGENIEGKKINGNEWLLMTDHISKRDLFGKCEKMIIFFRVNSIPFIYNFFSTAQTLSSISRGRGWTKNIFTFQSSNAFIYNNWYMRLQWLYYYYVL